LRQQKWDTDESEFTLRPEELDGIATKAKQFFNHFNKALESIRIANNAKPHVDQHMQAPASQSLPVQQAQPVPTTVPAMQTPKLARKMSAHKKVGVKAPAAPTSDKPPISFPAISPHGTPVYANNEFHPEKLTIPANKKRKPNAQGSASTTPLQATTSTLPAQRQVVPPAKIGTGIPSLDDQMSVKRDLPFKCRIPECEYGITGFDKKEECDKHMDSVHDYTGDALAFCLKKLHRALGLDKKVEAARNANAVGDNAMSGVAKNEVGVAGRLTVPALKKEGNSPGAQSMARSLTQTSAQGQNASKQQKAQANVKAGSEAPTSSAVKRSAGTAEFTDEVKKVGTTTERAGANNLWAKSLVSPQALRTVFGCFDHIGQPRELPDLDPSSSPETDSPAIDTPESGEEGRRQSDISDTADLRLEMSDWSPFVPEMAVFGELPHATADDKGGEAASQFVMDEDEYMHDWNETFGEGARSNGLLRFDDEGYVLNYDQVLGPFR